MQCKSGSRVDPLIIEHQIAIERVVLQLAGEVELGLALLYAELQHLLFLDDPAVPVQRCHRLVGVLQRQQGILRGLLVRPILQLHCVFFEELLLLPSLLWPFLNLRLLYLFFSRVPLFLIPTLLLRLHLDIPLQILQLLKIDLLLPTPHLIQLQPGHLALNPLGPLQLQLLLQFVDDLHGPEVLIPLNDDVFIFLI